MLLHWIGHPPLLAKLYDDMPLDGNDGRECSNHKKMCTLVAATGFIIDFHYEIWRTEKTSRPITDIPTPTINTLDVLIKLSIPVLYHGSMDANSIFNLA